MQLYIQSVESLPFGVVTAAQSRHSRHYGRWVSAARGGLEGVLDCRLKNAYLPDLFLIVTVNCQKYPSRYVKICCWQENNGSSMLTSTAKCRHVYLDEYNEIYHAKVPHTP